MTCIAGIVHEGRVWIGGDSAGVAGMSMMVRSDEKVFCNGDFILGFTDSFRMGDLLRYAFTPPEQMLSEVDDRQYLCTRWVDALRKCFEGGGYKRMHDNQEYGGCFLVGYRGHLYQVDRDFQVGEARHGYDAIGCGGAIATGALYAYTDEVYYGEREEIDPQQAVLIALEAAERHSAGVRGPYTILSGGAA